MRIMIDGPDGAGKTSVCEKLANKLGCNIVRLTNGGDRSFKSYSELMVPNNVIHDRTFLSEIIYPSYFGKESRLTFASKFSLYELIEIYKAKVFILTADNDELLKRLEIRGDEFLEDLNKIKGINREYLEIARERGYTIINTTNKTIDEVVDEIGGYLQ